MRLRWKLNLFASGFCSLGAILGAVLNVPVMAAIDLMFAVICWQVAVMGIDKDLSEKGE